MVVFTTGLSSESTPQQQALQDTSVRYYGIEMNGVLCGYSETSPSYGRVDGRDALIVNQKIHLKVSALGSEVNSEITMTFHADPATGQFFRAAMGVKQGPTEVASHITVEGDTARVTSWLYPGVQATFLPPGTVLETTLNSPHLVRDFVGTELTERVYRVLDIQDGKVHEKRYVRFGTESVKAAGRKYEACVLDEVDMTNGVKARIWMDPRTGETIRAEVANGSRVIYLATSSVVKDIRMASIDGNIFARTNVAIPSFKEISYLKVRAKIEPMGLWVTEEGLNVPGQRFQGTVNENLIEGVFEVSHRHYMGEGAPALRRTFSGDPSLRPYLEPGRLVQSSDPVLVKKAQDLTAGSSDSWDAACRLSRWVSENINYAIPGGATPRRTYDTRAGECGAHSLLLASFCRSVGIPARVVWGCMYVPNQGGAFGQHGWTEVYMGEAGWIPVDATVGEIDYVDCGHIRLGELEASSIGLNAKSMVIVDYRAGSTSMAGGTEVDPGRFAEYHGSYELPEAKLVLSVTTKGGQLTVDIPGKVVFALREPDEAGKWISTISDRLYCTFDREKEGAVSGLRIHELIMLPRSAGPDSVPEGVPAKFVPYLGSYTFPMRNVNFKVHYRDSSLAFDDPQAGRTTRLRLPDEQGGWPDESGRLMLYFKRDEQGKVSAMTMDAQSRFTRKGR